MVAKSDTFWKEGSWLDLPPDWVVIGGPVVAIVSMGASALAATIVRRSRFDALLRAIAWGSLVVVAIPTAIAASRLGRPDPDRYFSSLPRVGVVDVDGSIALDGDKRVTFARSNCLPAPALELGDTMTIPGCTTREIASKCKVCQPLTVLHDTKAGLYWLVGNSGRPEIVFEGSDKTARSQVSIQDLRGALGPPVAWTTGGAVGLAMGALLLARARRTADRGRVLRLAALALSSTLLCAAPLLFGFALGRW
jgi:hypothetical protein